MKKFLTCNGLFQCIIHSKVEGRFGAIEAINLPPLEPGPEWLTHMAKIYKNFIPEPACTISTRIGIFAKWPSSRLPLKTVNINIEVITQSILAEHFTLQRSRVRSLLRLWFHLMCVSFYVYYLGYLHNIENWYSPLKIRKIWSPRRECALGSTIH